MRVTDWANIDKGTLNSWTLDLDLSPGTRIFEREVTPGLVIPDADAAGVSSAVNVGAEGTVQQIEVEVDITHTYIGDIRIELVSPSGEIARIRNMSGGSQQNLSLQLDSGSSTALASMVGQGVNGIWILRVLGQIVAKRQRPVAWGADRLEYEIYLGRNHRR